MDFGHRDRVDNLDRDYFTLERLAGIFWTLAVANAVQVLRDGLEIRLASGISEQQGAGIEATAKQGDIALINTLEIGIGKDTGDVCGVCAIDIHDYCVFG